MGTIYIDTGGAATNSGSSDSNAADLSGTGDATVSGSDVTLTAGTDLTGVVTTAGPTQSSIYLAQASNSVQKVFWITAVSGSGGATPKVTVSVAPTGVTGSNWAIGGRMVYTPASIESALRAGDTMQFNNSPASRSGASFLTVRVNGSQSTGPVTVKAKTGVSVTLTITDTNVVIDNTSGFKLWEFRDLTFVQQGASGNAVSDAGVALRFINCNVTDAGGIGFSFTATASSMLGCGVSGTGGDGINHTATGYISGCYVHDVAGDGIEMAGGNSAYTTIEFSIVDTAAGRGIFYSGAPTTQGHIHACRQNTVYGCGNSGLEVTDVDVVVILRGNIFQDNGNAAGEFNAEWVAGAAEYAGCHDYNVFYQSGAGNNLSGLTANSTEFITDPGFTAAAGGDFSISSAGSAKATSYPGVFLGGSTGYLDIGAVQRQEAAGASGGISRARAAAGF